MLNGFSHSLSRFHKLFENLNLRKAFEKFLRLLRLCAQPQTIIYYQWYVMFCHCCPDNTEYMVLFSDFMTENY